MKPLAIALLAALASSSLADPIDDFIVAEMARQKVPGLTLAVVKDGKVIRTGAYGKADLELDVPAKVDNIFEIGSITKQFTAVLTLMMEEEGKLALDDPISKFIEEAPESWQKITVRNLLNQTSGLKEYVAVEGLGLLDEYDRKTFLEKMKPLALDFEPGVTFAYSNTNYALLGAVLDKVSGKTYPDLIAERIFKPLEMSKTTILDPDAIVIGRAHGYMNYEGSQFRTRQSMLANIADGAILSNVEDMVKWDLALHSGKLLKPSSYQKLTAPGVLNSGRTRPYGMGTMLTQLGGIPYIGHHGNSPGYSAGYGHFPTKNMSVILMANVYAINGQQWAMNIAERLEPSLKVLPPGAGKADPNLARAEKVKTALVSLAQAPPALDHLEPEFAAPLNTDRARMFPSPYTPLAKIDNIELIEETLSGKDQLLTYRVLTPTRNFIARIVWSSADKIADLSLRADGPPKQL